MIFLFLSSGLFLGWSLGANDAANVFGTAVGTRMLRFKTAAITCSLFVILGAVIGGAGTTETLGSLGSVNAIAGSFMVALSAGFTVFWMTRLKLPVSTSQAVVGAIIGWNFFSGSLTDYDSLVKIVLTWVFSPIIAGIFAALLFIVLRAIIGRAKIHLLKLDAYTRVGLLIAGAFGAYSLGANNIANVMGVFVPVSPFVDMEISGLFTISGTQQLFFLGGIAIAVGVFTYSKRVMMTVGEGLFKLSPISALIVVLSQALVLFIFSSVALEHFLITSGLPPIPLVPVSSSQAVIGAVIGISIAKGGRGIRYNVLGEITMGWIATPIAAGIITFIALFFLQNVFNQEVSRKTTFLISEPVINHLALKNIDANNLDDFVGQIYENPIKFESVLKRRTEYSTSEIREIIVSSEIANFHVDPSTIKREINGKWFTPEQISSLKALENCTYNYKWEFIEALEAVSEKWRFKVNTKENRLFNKDLRLKREFVFRIFHINESGKDD